MIQLHVTVNGVEKVIAGLEKIQGRAKDLRPAFKVARMLIMESTQRTFMAEGRPDRWQPLSEMTLTRRGQNARILRDKGILMASIGISSADGIFVLKPLELRVGTNVPYARYHQDGIGVPQREFMVLLPEDEEKISKAILDHIVGDQA